MQNWNTPEQQTTRGIRRLACVSALAMACAIGLPRAAHAQIVPPPVPAGLEVPAPNEVFLLGRGVGTQNYVCQPADSLGRVAWTLFTPEATLFTDEKEQLTSHFFSPNPHEAGNVVRATWEDSRDTSIVWARAVASAADPTGSGAIAWVKLQTAGTQVGPTGGDTLSKTTFVQRLNTTGGSAPATGCDTPMDIGRKAFVPYTADYFFYKVPGTN